MTRTIERRVAQLEATTEGGDRCPGCGNGPEDDKRRRMASKAARSKPNRELSSIKALLEDLTERVLSGELETGRAAVANQLTNTRLRAIEQERKLRELEELEGRLEALEVVLRGRKRA